MALDAKEMKLQAHRLRMTGLTVVNALLQTLIVALYAWTGTVSWHLVLAFCLVSTGTAVAFTLIIAMNWNLRLKDRGLLLPQLVVALATQLLFLILAPKLWLVFLVSILVAYNFAMMSFNPRQFTAAWLIFGATTGMALYAGRSEFGYPGTTDAHIAILWLFFFLAIRRLTTIGAQFSRLRDQLSEKNRQLQAALEKNQEMASRDDLTGTYNRRFFMQLLADERERSQRSGAMFYVAIFDIDHFKSVNDRYGHLIGDAVLREFCQIVQSSLRTTDRFARYGGEEFVMMLTATSSPEAAVMPVERIRQAIQRKDWHAIAPGLQVTVSCGITAYCPPEPVEEVLGRADQALYDAKHAGRNRFVLV